MPSGQRFILVVRLDAAGDETRLVGSPRRHLVGGPLRHRGGGLVDVVGELGRQSVFGESDRHRIERVRLEDVGAGFEITGVDRLDDVRPSDAEEIVEAAQLLVIGMILEAFATEVGLFELVGLDHRPHGAVEKQDPLGEELLEDLTGRGARQIHANVFPGGPAGRSAYSTVGGDGFDRADGANRSAASAASGSVR